MSNQWNIYGISINKGMYFRNMYGNEIMIFVHDHKNQLPTITKATTV